MEHPGQERRNTAVPLMRAPRMTADEYAFGATARAHEVREYRPTLEAYGVPGHVGGEIEYADSDDEKESSDDEDTAPLLELSKTAATSAGKTMGGWLRRRATFPKRGVSVSFFCRRPLQHSYSVVDDGPDGVSFVPDISQAEWNERVQKVDAAEKESGVKRKFSKRLSSGAASVKSFGKKCASQVSRYCRVDSVLASPQEEDEERLLPSSATVTDSQPPDLEPPTYTTNTESQARELRRVPSGLYNAYPSPKTRSVGLASMTTATDTHGAASPTTSFQSANIRDPRTEGEDGFLQSLRASLIRYQDIGRFMDTARERYFGHFVGNNTTEAQQWAAHHSHQTEAEGEEIFREVEKRQVQDAARKGVKKIRGMSIPYSEIVEAQDLRLKRVPARRHTVASVVGVVGTAIQKCGHGLM